ncbi:hypothetical protein [Microbacterium sp. CPCC 204701]|uniref:hypothetical protein n=1 Tax=Microbacterium sp. CPCC 204701 TaxID=2493084 RepID=UPI000FDB9D48|nr:hypothetical protein [Microbacterium sp. CPCC 204701]
MDDVQLLESFASGTLREFPHSDHIRVVFLRTRSHGTEEALQFMSDGIRQMAESAGAPEKYHATITAAWTKIVGALVQTSDPRTGFDEFLTEHSELLRRDLLLEYYTRDLLRSTAARASFVEPDIRPLP